MKRGFIVMRLTRIEIERLKDEISDRSGVWVGLIHIYENGRFEITDLDDINVNRVYSVLSNRKDVRNLYKAKRYQYFSLNPYSLPKMKYTISGDFFEKV
jgi:hypothetical protein